MDENNKLPLTEDQFEEMQNNFSKFLSSFYELPEFDSDRYFFTEKQANEMSSLLFGFQCFLHLKFKEKKETFLIGIRASKCS